MNAPTPARDPNLGPGTPHRLFIHEPGWRIAQKAGSEREFCHVMAPGQDYYHRLYDGELYLYLADERLCMACAERRGLLSDRPKGLREPAGEIEIDIDLSGSYVEEPLAGPEGNGSRYDPSR